MRGETSRPEGYLWQGNPKKWYGNGTMDSYIADKSQYIYWATPQCRDDIRVGDKAFIRRAVGGVGPRGIIATGTVAELPREYSQTTLSQFRYPHLVGIGEEAASSVWKTGISLSEVRLREKREWSRRKCWSQFIQICMFSECLGELFTGLVPKRFKKLKRCGRALVKYI